MGFYNFLWNFRFYLQGRVRRDWDTSICPTATQLAADPSNPDGSLADSNRRPGAAPIDMIFDIRCISGRAGESRLRECIYPAEFCVCWRFLQTDSQLDSRKVTQTSQWTWFSLTFVCTRKNARYQHIPRQFKLFRVERARRLYQNVNRTDFRLFRWLTIWTGARTSFIPQLQCCTSACSIFTTVTQPLSLRYVTFFQWRVTNNSE